MTSIFQTWLPSHLADVPAVDREQLTSLSVALASEWSVEAPLVERLAETVKWIPLVKTCAPLNTHVTAVHACADCLTSGAQS